MDKEPEGLQSNTSPRYEEVPKCNILPSYQLYASTFSKNFNLSEEDRQLRPPEYFESSVLSPPSEMSGEYFPTPQQQNRDMEELASRWENTLLANTHLLKRFPDSKHGVNKDSKHINTAKKSPLEISIHLNMDKSTCELKEFQQGDYISGYVLVSNPTKKPVPFSMFSVVLEGKISVANTKGVAMDAKTPLIFYKFLNMLDYNASWTPACIDQDGLVVYEDGTLSQFPFDKVIESETTYKKHFNFTIPDKLLDCACEIHNLSQHCKLLPSIGLARDEFISQLRIRGGPHQKNGSKNSHLRDFSFPDTSLSYSIEARVIGKASDFPQVFKEVKDQFVLINEASHYFKITPKETLNFKIPRTQIVRESRLIYENFIKRIEEVYEKAAEIKNGKLSRRPSIAKRPQLFHSQSKENINLKYNITYSITKRTLSTSKNIGTCTISTPKKEYVVSYCNQNLVSPKDTSLQIPFDFNFSGTAKPPDIKNVNVELTMFTYRSKKYFIPIEIYHDMLFQNKTGKDDFEEIVQKKARENLAKVTSLAQEIQWEKLELSKRLVMDIKSVADLETKYNKVKLDHIKHSTITWKNSNISQGYFGHTVLSMDISKYKSEEIGKCRLVPSFQSCVIGRLYYLRITFLMSNTEMEVKIPLIIERDD